MPASLTIPYGICGAFGNGVNLRAESTTHWLATELGKPLVLFGFAAQFVFFMRFAVQWFVSERRGRSHVPVSFWWISVVGGLMTLTYAVLKPDLVFMVSQALGLLIYFRNLALIYGRAARYRKLRESRSTALGQVEPTPSR